MRPTFQAAMHAMHAPIAEHFPRLSALSAPAQSDDTFAWRGVLMMTMMMMLLGWSFGVQCATAARPQPNLIMLREMLVNFNYGCGDAGGDAGAREIRHGMPARTDMQCVR